MNISDKACCNVQQTETLINSGQHPGVARFEGARVASALRLVYFAKT